MCINMKLGANRRASAADGASCPTPTPETPGRPKPRPKPAGGSALLSEVEGPPAWTQGFALLE